MSKGASTIEPAVMNRDEAFAYLGGRRAILFALIEAGLVAPLTHGHKRTTFLRTSLDEALEVARRNAMDLSPSPGVRTLTQAIAAAAVVKKEGGRK